MADEGGAEQARWLQREAQEDLADVIVRQKRRHGHVVRGVVTGESRVGFLRNLAARYLFNTSSFWLLQ